ncbi:MAG: transglycosylase SLT domain-containing protein [Gammaproteobacteria bacterium]|nr:transglycosylase SLT domain-containing protein [Gammaproteobacteria bacterium]MYI77269.1 transglycosylase SLT domain-containing protein [Gammaproteobacteria bacterium]
MSFFNLRTLLVASTWLSLVQFSSVCASDLDAQRELYQQAKSAFKAGRNSEFQQLKNKLTDYPLYPYLLYNEALKRMSSLSPDDANQLRSQLSGSVLEDEFFRRWLDTQARRKRWQIYVDHFEPTTDAARQCTYLRALFRLGYEDKALSGVPELWTVGVSQPKVCDPIFDVWINRGNLNSDIAWNRLQLAVQERSTILARYLLRFFPRAEQPTARLLYDVYRRPSIVRSVNRFPDDARGRYVFSFGLLRYARDEASKALALWQEHKDEFDFDEQLAIRTENELAFWAAREGVVLTEVSPKHTYETIERIADTAIAKREWSIAYEWLNSVEETERYRYKWRYWFAKSLQETGNDGAQEILEELAGERTYYGFLAADEIDVPLKMNARNSIELEQQSDEFLADIRIARIFELYKLGEEDNAKEEWSWLLPRLNDDAAKHWIPYQIGQIGHPNHAILAAFRADAVDLVETRFPVLYVDEFNRHTDRTEIDLTVLLALARQESAFNPKAISPVGARGLMQLMPATARRTARNIRVPQPSLVGLLYAPTNIQIGTYHFRELLDEFDEHKVLAYAAYNAGSHRVKQWIKDASGMDTIAWIETIPFYETRNYVKNVLAFQQVYAFLLDTPTPILAPHEKTIP